MEINIDIPDGQSGDWKIETFIVTEDEIKLFNIRAMFHLGQRIMEAGTYKRLNAMLVWPRSHYNSWQLFGHSHGGLSHTNSDNLIHGKQMDVGVDTNNFYPYSFEQIQKIMEKRPDNFNLVRK